MLCHVCEDNQTTAYMKSVDTSLFYKSDFFFLKLGFTPCKAEQPLQGMELQEKKRLPKTLMRMNFNSFIIIKNKIKQHSN